MSKIIEELNENGIKEDFRESEDFFSVKDFTFAGKITSSSKSLLKQDQPYSTDTGRILHVLEGDATYTINLSKYNIYRGDIIIIPPDSIVEVNRFSDDYILQAITLPETTHNNIIDLNQDSECLMFSLCSKGDKLIREYFEFIRLVLIYEGYQPQLIITLTEALYQNIMLLYNRQETVNSGRVGNRKNELMKKFFLLVKQHCVNERNIGFYSGQLFVSSCYLSILVKQESGHSVMYWVNRSLIYRAKIALEYTDNTITEISDDLNFSTTSFFCRFFKNATGITPTQYRNNNK